MTDARGDEELMLAFQRGEAGAFRTLVERHRQAVYLFILRWTGNPARSEDLLQEAWLRVIRGASAYRPSARFKTWLYTVARNLCVDSARRERHRSGVSLDQPVADGADDAATIGSTLADPEALPEKEAYHLSLRPLLQRALDALPAEQREVFILREYNGLTFREIGEVTGVPDNTVKSRMRYALESLRRTLQELGVDGASMDAGRAVS